MPDRFLRRAIDDEEIWVDAQGGDFYALNATAARVLALWRDGLRAPAAIAERLTETFDVEPAAAAAAVRDVLAEAERLGLLEA